MPSPTLELGLCSIAAAALFALASCGEGARPASESDLEPRADLSAPVLKPAQRAQSEVLTGVRRALDHGRAEEARALLEQAPVPELEGFLLQARLAAITGRDTEAMRSIEAARKLSPKDPCVYAAAAEIYSGMGKTTTAWGEILGGEKTCGPSSEFLRARGILSISRQGGARKGLALLEQARAADPEIPFIDRALGQAHLLVAKEQAKADDLTLALEHARASLKFDPDDVDARRFLSEMLSAIGDFKGSIAVLEGLIESGEPLQSELALTFKKAAVVALLAHDREAALADFVAARKLGLSDEELSSGTAILAQAARSELESGVEAYRKQDLEGAERHFRRALDFGPDLIEAQNHLAIVLFKKRQFGDSVRLWQRVIATARAEKIALPEPVHLNLAKAQLQNHDREGAALTLEEYLDRQPSGEWVAATREMLASLPAAERPR